jgi:hypothetical protein
MVFRERTLTSSLLFLLVMVGPSLTQSNQTQQGPRTFPAAKDMKSLGLARGGAQPERFKPNPLANSLSQNHHAFAAVPPTDLASELAEATLPATSKKYSLPELSGVNFLSSARFRPREFRNFRASGLNTSKLRNAKLPDLSKAQ